MCSEYPRSGVVLTYPCRCCTSALTSKLSPTTLRGSSHARPSAGPLRHLRLSCMRACARVCERACSVCVGVCVGVPVWVRAAVVEEPVGRPCLRGSFGSAQRLKCCTRSSGKSLRGLLIAHGTGAATRIRTRSCRRRRRSASTTRCECTESSVTVPAHCRTLADRPHAR